jgi:23S rRNA pseudouridine955/2504/2580 synthase/23S rRNA pseudouridine1911/1915/1917 synthase
LPKFHLDIIFENNNFVAINKPAGLLSIPDREQTQTSLKDILIEKYGKIFTVHRLDRDTSGVIVFAKNEDTHKYLSQLFESRAVEKHYQAIVVGTPTEKKGTIDAPIAENMLDRGRMIIHQRGKASVTDYEVLEEYKFYSLVQFQLHTGRTHQIRIHSQLIGHPVVCDDIYGDGKPILLSSFKRKFKLSKNEEEERPMLNRVALHSYQLKFEDANGKEIILTAELPKDMRATLQQMRKHL